jgi:hypothetical protein
MIDQTHNLKNLHETELQPILDELEQQRIRLRNQVLISTAAIVPVVLLLIGVLMNAMGGFGLVLPIVLGMGAWAFFNGSKIQEYRRNFKRKVIGRMVHAYDPNLSYYPDRGISREEFRASRIYPSRIDRYSHEDLFTGVVGETDFRFSELHAQYKMTTTDSKGRRRTTYHTIFKGIFFVADFNKHFNGLTFVLPDNAESMLGGVGRMFQEWGSKLDGRPGELVKLEDPDFEKLFVVHSTDQVEARYILSLSLMRRLSEFRRRLDVPVAISFVDSNIYIAISTRKNHFEPPSFLTGSAQLTRAEFATYLEDIRLAEGIVEDLNLNTRIWSKQ